VVRRLKVDEGMMHETNAQSQHTYRDTSQNGRLLLLVGKTLAREKCGSSIRELDGWV
jgi:hypothetical protein